MYSTGESSIINLAPARSQSCRLQFRRSTRGRDLIVQQTGKEVRIVLTRHLTGKVTGRQLELVALG